MKAKPIGTPIFHFGAIQIIFSRPYTVPGFAGTSRTSQTVLRYTKHGTWRFSSIGTESPPITNYHHWSPFAEYLTPKLAAAIHGVWRGHSQWMPPHKRNARQYRREKAWARVLKKFFAEAHALEKKWEKRRLQAAALWRELNPTAGRQSRSPACGSPEASASQEINSGR